MIPRHSNFVPQDSVFPFGGVNYSDPSTMVDPRLSPEMLNVSVDKGHLKKRTGYTGFGGAVNGTPLAMFEFETLAGVTELLLITTTKEYKYNTGTGLWTDITYKNPAAATVNRTGTEENGLDYAIVTGYRLNDAGTETLVKWVIITNGVDKPRYWDGTNAQFFEYSTATIANKGANLLYTSFVTMKTISAINGYLVMANVTTTSNEPSTVVWSNTGKLYDWGTGASGAGNSGAVPLTEALGSIQKLETLADRLMVYADDSIHVMTHVGGNDVFSIEKLITGTRLVSARSIVNVRGFHLFLSQENILLFDGSRSFRPVGDPIAVRYRDEIKADIRQRAFGFLDVVKNHVYFVVPTADAESIVYKLEYDEYDVGNVKWTRESYAQRLTAMGFWKRTTTLKWNDASLVGKTWASMAMNWNQGAIKGGFPQRIVGFAAGTGLANDQNFADDAAMITANWDSIDLTVPRSYLSELGRWLSLELELKGQTCDIYYSVNRGTNYQLLSQNQQLTGEWERYKFDIDVVSDTLRLRVQNAQTNGFELRWFRASVAPVGER